MEKIGGVIVTHGRLANELLKAAEQVVGDLDHIASVSIGGNDDVEQSQNEIKNAIEKVSNKNRESYLFHLQAKLPYLFAKRNPRGQIPHRLLL